jgi:hypothetical protein
LVTALTIMYYNRRNQPRAARGIGSSVKYSLGVAALAASGFRAPCAPYHRPWQLPSGSLFRTIHVVPLLHRFAFALRNRTPAPRSSDFLPGSIKITSAASRARRHLCNAEGVFRWSKIAAIFFLGQSREKTRSNRQCGVIEIVMRVVDGTAADGAGNANIRACKQSPLPP